MADTVTGPTILQQNDKRVTIKIVVQSDGTGSTGGTTVTKGTTKSAAMTNDVDLIPYIGIEANAGAAEAIHCHYVAASRIINE